MSYQEEQETLETVKYWWKKWGKYILVALVISSIGFISFNGWTYLQQKKASQAVVLYEQYLAASEKSDIEHAKRIAADMQKNFSNTAYASLTTLKLASMLFDKNESNLALDQLKWLISNNSSKAFQPIAKLNMASILLDQKKYDDALSQLNVVQKGFKAAYADKRGDILVLSGKTKEAVDNYKIAIDEMKADDPLKQLVQIKLDMLTQGKAQTSSTIF